MIRRWLARRKMRWAVRQVAHEHARTCPGETLSVSRLSGALVWNRTTHHSSGWCYSREAMLYVMESDAS
ncbi:hypothetical protein LCGC14_1228170 [marine sediment metagenome]|uniref:Uncharacterized protein n=1 Tax=marine sediment metagenome TaxID=412755 RepID=A0A0F9LDE8_9ZZZZ